MASSCAHCCKPIDTRGHYYEIRIVEWNDNRGKMRRKRNYHIECRPPE